MYLDAHHHCEIIDLSVKWSEARTIAVGIGRFKFTVESVRIDIDRLQFVSSDRDIMPFVSITYR